MPRRDIGACAGTECGYFPTGINGTMLYSYFLGESKAPSYSEQLNCKVVKIGEAIQITTSPINSNYPANVFLSGNDLALTYVQYRNNIPGATTTNSIRQGWNNASVWVSDYRIPKYSIGKLAPLWLMFQGASEFSRRGSNVWISAFGDGNYFEFSKQKNIIPHVQVQKYWTNGFSSYSEDVNCQSPNNSEQTIVQRALFKINAWTNCAGIKFPESCVVSVKRLNTKGTVETLISEAQYTFQTIQIQKTSNPDLEIKIPLLSQIEDMRPLERGEFQSGVSYRSTNGIIASNLSQVSNNGMRYALAAGDRKPASSETTKSRRVIVVVLLTFVASFPIILWLIKSKSSRGNTE